MSRFIPEEDGGKLKPANYEQTYTAEQIVILNKCMTDYEHFVCNYVFLPGSDPKRPNTGTVQYKPYDYQLKMLHNYHNYSRVITMVSRQAGKTITACTYLLWYAMFHPKQTILIAANKGDTAKEAMTKLREIYLECPWFLKPGLAVDNVHQLKFDNGSRILAETTTKDTGRGKSINILYLDEFAYVEPRIQQDFWAAVQPTLSTTEGKMFITSTPNTDEDKFANIWFSAIDAPNSTQWKDDFLEQAGIDPAKMPKNNYETRYEDPLLMDEERSRYEDESIGTEARLDGFRRMFIHWAEHPKRGEKFMQKTLREGVSLSTWHREYECRFVSKDDTLIESGRLLLLNAYKRKPRLVSKHGVRWYRPIRPNVAYGVTLDPSEGMGLDNACIQVWELPKLRQVAEWTTNKADQLEQAKQLFRVMQFIEDEQQDHPDHAGHSRIYYTVEANGVGNGILSIIDRELRESQLPGELVDENHDKRRGILTTVKTKREYCLRLKLLIERGRFVPCSAPLISELKTFIKRGQSYAAKTGTFDDRVMACVQMLHMLAVIADWDEDVDDALRVDVLDAELDDGSLSIPDGDGPDGSPLDFA